MADSHNASSDKPASPCGIAANHVDAIVRDIITQVCDLGGYTSPDDQPDLLQCTASELETCIRRALGEDV